MLKSIYSGASGLILPRFVCRIRSYAASRVRRRKQTPPIESNINGEEDEVKTEKTICPHFITRTVGLNKPRWAPVFKKHPELRTINRQNALYTIKVLKDLNFDAKDIYLKPMILYVNGLTIENRYWILQECGIQPITIARVFKYITIMNKSVVELKTQQYMPYDLEVFQKLSAVITGFDERSIKDKYNENMELKKIREMMLNEFLKQRLNMNDTELTKLWKCYGRIRHKSFRSIQSIINLLLDDLNFSKERIIKNAFLLYADSANVRRILKEIPEIGNQDIRDIGYRRPKILMSNCDTLLKTLQHVKAFGISEEAVTRCLEVLTLGPDTILERLRDLNEVEEFRVLMTNPRVLRLVHYQNKARLRLEYLNQIKVRCASLHILSCGSEAFAKFARDGSDRTKGRDCVVFLSKIMNRDESDVRNLMSRHPNWCHIPSLHVKQLYEYLLSKKFSNDEIYQNIHLLLYPIKRIEEKLSLLNNAENFEILDLCNINSIYDLSKNEILTLVLYLIEREFHFTGDGVWTEHHTHQMENFSNLLPDFPEVVNKVYKYGLKPPPPPTANQNLETQTSPTT